MALGTSRPRAGGGAEAKRIEGRLERYHKRFKELVAQGIDKKEASKIAFEEITGYRYKNG